MSFDVASVKQNKSGLPPSGDRPNSNLPLGPGDVYSPNGGFFSATNIQALIYISFAYKLSNNQLQVLIPQLPKWVNTDRFDIQAKADGNPTKDQMRLMMQSLLADRFKLAIHTEMRQLPVFALVLVKPGKTGLQLQSHPTDVPCSNAPPRADTGSNAPTVAGGFPATCGGLQGLEPSAPGRYHVGARNVSMALIATSMTGWGDLDRPILDKTGLSGTFDFSLEWTPQFEGPLPPGNTFQPDPTGPTFIEAVREQFGLKLESQTGPVEVTVVDHVEQPSEN